jgi:hypothetical protein
MDFLRCNPVSKHKAKSVPTNENIRKLRQASDNARRKLKMSEYNKDNGNCPPSIYGDPAKTQNITICH